MRLGSYLCEWKKSKTLVNGFSETSLSNYFFFFAAGFFFAGAFLAGAFFFAFEAVAFFFAGAFFFATGIASLLRKRFHFP